jgi:hypothetical protein
MQVGVPPRWQNFAEGVKRGGRFRQRLQLQGDVEPTNAATREQLRNTSDKGAVETSNLDESFFRADDCYVGGN